MITRSAVLMAGIVIVSLVPVSAAGQGGAPTADTTSLRTGWGGLRLCRLTRVHYPSSTAPSVGVVRNYDDFLGVTTASSHRKNNKQQ